MRRLTVATLLLSLTVACEAEDDSGAEYALPEAPRCVLAAPTPGSVTAAGTSLVDEHGRILTLRGINAGGRSKFAPYSPFDYPAGGFDEALGSYLDRAQAWGFNVLRVPFSWEGIEPVQDSYDEQLLDRYDQLLDSAWQRGLWTIVDFHQDIYSEAYCGDGFPGWTLDNPPEPHHDCPSWFMSYFTNDDVKAAFDAFWSDSTGVRTELGEMWEMMAERHKDRPGVLGYEIINEPSPGSADRATWEVEVLAPFYSEFVARLQQRDPDALIFFDVSGMQAVSPATALPRPEGDNLVFAPHFYDSGALIGGMVSEDLLTPLSVWKDQADAWDVPVLLGEYGIKATHQAATEHARRHYEALNKLGMHGTWWEYSDSAERWNEEDLSVVDTEGNERPALLDSIVQPYAAALAGELQVILHDPATASFYLEYTPAEAGGVSDIAVPQRLYGGGLRVGAQGACVHETDGHLLVQADSGAALVRLSLDRSAP